MIKSLKYISVKNFRNYFKSSLEITKKEVEEIKMKYRKNQKFIRNNFKSCQILTKLEFNKLKFNLSLSFIRLEEPYHFAKIVPVVKENLRKHHQKK